MLSFHQLQIDTKTKYKIQQVTFLKIVFMQKLFEPRVHVFGIKQELNVPRLLIGSLTHICLVDFSIQSIFQMGQVMRKCVMTYKAGVINWNIG